MDGDLASGLLITALLLAVGHWFPWPHRLHRVAAYTYGLLSILAGVAVWLGRQNLWSVWWGLVNFALVGGATVCAVYLIDWALNAYLRQRSERK